MRRRRSAEASSHVEAGGRYRSEPRRGRARNTPDSYPVYDERYARYKNLVVTTYRAYRIRLLSSFAVPSRKLRHEVHVMRDLVADWRKWSSAERLLAMVLIL